MIKLTNYMPKPRAKYETGSRVSKYNFGECQAVTDLAQGIRGDTLIYGSTLDGISTKELTALGRLISSAAHSYMKSNPDKFLDRRLVKFTEPEVRTDEHGVSVQGERVGVYLVYKT